MPTRVKVAETKANVCPYCNAKMEETEGASEMLLNGRCIVWCAYCGGSYYYFKARG